MRGRVLFLAAVLMLPGCSARAVDLFTPVPPERITAGTQLFQLH